MGKTQGGSGRKGKRQPGIVLASKGHGNVTRYLSKDFFPELLVFILSYVKLHLQDNGREERGGIVSAQEPLTGRAISY